MCDVVNAVRRAIEVLTASRAAAVDYSKQAGGWVDFTGNDDDDAAAIWAEVLMLPPEQNLALMWKVMKDNPRMGEAALLDLTCFAAHHLSGGDRFGREGLMYWVRHWARRDGSSREAAYLYGKTHVTHQVFYREQVAVLLDGWFIAAKGAIEPAIPSYYGAMTEAA